MATSWTTRQGTVITQLLNKRCNVFLVSCGDKHLLVDSSRKPERELLVQGLKALGIDHLEFLILTHTHFDHTENAAFIQRNYGAKVIVHEKEAALLGAGYTPIPPGTVLFTKFITTFIAPFLKKKFVYEPCQADVLVKDELDLSDYGFTARIIHTPGHTKGSMSLIIDNEIALVGDAMFGILPNKIFPPYGEDVPGIIKSWEKLLATSCYLFISSHGTENTRALVQDGYGKEKARD